MSSQTLGVPVPQESLSQESWKWYAKLILILIVFIFIYIKVKPYISQLLDVIETIRQLLNMVISFAGDVSKDVVDETSVGSKVIVNKLSKPVPEPDESINQSKGETKGYCFVGEWKGVRSCVKVNGECPTEVYSTKQQCVNPELR